MADLIVTLQGADPLAGQTQLSLGQTLRLLLAQIWTVRAPVTRRGVFQGAVGLRLFIRRYGQPVQVLVW